MSVYFLANIRIHNRAEYQLYLDRADAVFSKYNGSYLAVDKEPEVLEGDWDQGRAVLISFDSREDFDAWYGSDDYQEILKFRLSSADCRAILIQGS